MYAYKTYSVFDGFGSPYGSMELKINTGADIYLGHVLATLGHHHISIIICVRCYTEF
jgi:hypothetical protein